MTETRLAYGRATLAEAALADGDPLVFTASTRGMNRRGFQLRTEGWRLDNFNANPVVLWMHDSWEPPIGKGHAATEKDALRIPVEFDLADPFASKIDSKYRRGFLNAVSVGFHFVNEDGEPVDSWRLESDEIRDELFYDLCELSAVTIPADPGALRQQHRLALRSLGKELVDLFDEQEHPQGEITQTQLQAAVAAELARLGIELPKNAPPETPEAPAAGIDHDAAQVVLAAFTLEGTLS